MNSANQFSYLVPTKILFVQNAWEKLRDEISNKRFLLVASSGAVSRFDIFRELLDHENLAHYIESVPSHPDISDAEKLFADAHQKKFDTVVAIGGGSVIDIAKFLSVKPETGRFTELRQHLEFGNVLSNYVVRPVIAVPTTAGTSSEITPFATIWNRQQNRKHSLQLPDLWCSIAIYDPTLTISKPKNLTLNSALDALSHSLESIWNVNSNPISVSLATTAAKLIINNLPTLISNLKDEHSREKIMLGSVFAGLAFSNTRTAAAHALSYQITLKRGIEHGLACSFTLPMLIDNVRGKYQFVDEALTDIFGDTSSAPLRSFLSSLGVSCNLQDYGISIPEYNKMLDELDSSRASNSLAHFCKI